MEQTSLRQELLLAAARWARRWADSVLERAPARPVPAPAPPAPKPALPEPRIGLFEEEGPPEHWLARVREGAPELLAGLEAPLRAQPARAARPAPPPAYPEDPPLPAAFFGYSEPPSQPPLAPEPRFYPRAAAVPPSSPRVSRDTAPGPARVPAPAFATAPTWPPLEPRFVAAPAQPVGVAEPGRVAAAAPALAPSESPASGVATPSGQVLRFGPRAQRLPLEPRFSEQQEPRPAPDPARPAPPPRAEPLAPRYEGAPPERAPVPVGYLAPRARDAAPAPSFAPAPEPWPELPDEAPSGEAPDVSSRERERLRRLDREQRGD